jgi:hypothetical protein
LGKSSHLRIAAAEQTPRRTSVRQALADAVEQHNAVVERLAAIAAAERTARAEYNAAVDAAAAATAAIEAAKVDAVSHRINRFLGVRRSPPRSVLFRREQAQAADDQRAAVQAAQHALAEQKKQAENSLVIARLALSGRIQDVLKDEAPVEQLIVGFHKLRREFVAREQLVQWLDTKHAIHPDRFWQRDRVALVDETAEWKAALAALESDADAPLPS